jgi:cell wall-associated NlpC family hydrolase
MTSRSATAPVGPRAKRWTRGRRLLLAVTLALVAPALLGAQAQAASGGVAPTKSTATVPGSKAKLVRGRAIAPAEAPRAVKRVIAAANKIRKKPYKYGGGHGRWRDKGYDCSGAVSFALHGAKLLKTPLDSRGLARFGIKREGEWISVYGAPSHAYMVVAGLRFDTSMTRGNGPGWSKSMRSTPERYKVRHPRGL